MYWFSVHLKKMAAYTTGYHALDGSTIYSNDNNVEIYLLGYDPDII